MSDDHTDGFEVPLHRSLTERQLLGGAPGPAVIINGTLTLAAAMALASLWVVPFGFAVHLVMVSVCREDPEFLEVLAAYLKQSDRFRT